MGYHVDLMLGNKTRGILLALIFQGVIPVNKRYIFPELMHIYQPRQGSLRGVDDLVSSMALESINIYVNRAAVMN